MNDANAMMAQSAAPSSGTMQLANAIAMAIEPMIEEVKVEVSGLRDDHDKRITNLEDNEALRDEQVRAIDAEINHHVSKLLNITWIRPRVVADECIEDKQRYFGRLRSEVIDYFKDYIHYPRSKRWMYIPRKYYPDVIKCVREFEPIGGIEDFKARADKAIAAIEARKAQARLSER